MLGEVTQMQLAACVLLGQSLIFKIAGTDTYSL